MRPGPILALALLLSGGIAARADTISTFDIKGASIFYGLGGDMNTVSGMTTIDVTTGIVKSISFTAGGLYQSGVDFQLGPIVFVGSRYAEVSFDAGSLLIYMGSAFDLNGPNDLYVGHITLDTTTPVPTATTPEPSTVILLSTGLLSAAGLVRRRYGLCSARGAVTS